MIVNDRSVLILDVMGVGVAVGGIEFLGRWGCCSGTAVVGQLQSVASSPSRHSSAAPLRNLPNRQREQLGLSGRSADRWCKSAQRLTRL